MNGVIVALGIMVSLQYLVIGTYVVPRLARLADEPGPIIRAGQLGAAAFFIGCGLTHAGIAVHALTDPSTGPATHLLLVHVGPHLAQVLGGATFIWIAARKLEIRFTPKEFAALERARAQAIDALRSAEERFRTAFELAPNGVALVSVEAGSFGRFVQVNQALCEIVGYSEQELLALSVDAITHPDDRVPNDEMLQRLLDSETAEYSVEKRYLHRNGHPVWVAVTAALIRDADGRPLHTVTQVQDITDRKRFEGQLQYLADHDPLTGLFNRRRLAAELERALIHVKRHRTPAALLVVDIDNFKYINDTYGHAVGDAVIGRVASGLRRRLRETDVVGRLGGDEFAVLLADVDANASEAVATDLLATIRVQDAVVAAGRRVSVTASVGVNPIEPDRNVTADELLIEADIAMYDAKENGRNRIALAGSDDGHQPRMRARLSWGDRIRDALDHDGFLLYEQPIMTLASGKVNRSELLLRMRGDNGDVIAPGVFLEVAERFGQIQAIDRWVIRRAIALLTERQHAGIDRSVEVNLSGVSITDEQVIDFIAAEVAAAPIDPTKLTFEVTETAAIINVERARGFADRLARLGCHFALDDFGAGFGSFYYLKHLPFDCVKIDGDFIRQLPSSRADQLTVKAIVQIARGLGKETIAEFVEDETTLELLGEYGVDHAQGYHIGRPQPVDDSLSLAQTPAVTLEPPSNVRQDLAAPLPRQ